jgi:hypothetical protein
MAASAAVAAGTGVVGHVVGSVASDVAGSVIGLGINAVFDAAGQWVASGAVWLLGQVGGAMSATTSVDLSAGWFSAHESVMATMAAAVVLPMVLCAAIQAIYRQSASMLARAFLVQLPLALLLTGVAVELVQMALAVTDALSAQVLASAGVDTRHILDGVTQALNGTGPAALAVPAFVVFIGGLLVAVAALGLWLELVVRAAAVSVAVLFLPLALAALVWPAVSHWCRRLAETLAALVLSKLVIAAVLSLATGALVGGLGAGATGGDGGGFSAVITGIALLVIATVAPFTLLRLIPAVEAGAVSHLESARSRLAAAPGQARNEVLDIQSRMIGRGEGASGGAAPAGTTTAALPMVTGAPATGFPPAGAAGGGGGGGAGPGGPVPGGSRPGGSTPGPGPSTGRPGSGPGGGSVDVGSEPMARPMVAGSAVPGPAGSWDRDRSSVPTGEGSGPDE